MQKQRWMAAALGLLPLVAGADVTLYGQILGGFERVKSANDKTVNRVADFGSRIGFKGDEDLGGGQKAIWQVETGFRLDGQAPSAPIQSGTLGSRQSFVGLAGGWGTLRLGNLYNYGYSDMEIVNPWQSETNALQLMNFTGIDTVYRNAVRYDSPVMAGFDLSLMVAPDENAAIRRDIAIVGAGYANGPLTVKYQLLRQNGTEPAPADLLHRIEANWAFGDLTLGAGYARNSVHDAAGNRRVAADAVATAVYTTGAWRAKASFDRGWDVKLNGEKQADTAYRQWIVGVDYLLSKRTTAGVSYGRINTSRDNAYCNAPSDNPNLFVSCARESALGVQLTHMF